MWVPFAIVGAVVWSGRTYYHQESEPKPINLAQRRPWAIATDLVGLSRHRVHDGP
jgi:hypothetical protein